MEETKKEQQLPERKKTFKIENNSYEVEFFSTGQLLEIEVLKAQLAEGQYNEITKAGTVNSSYARALIDMIATFTILFPQLKKDMNVKTISELQAVDSKKLLQIYLNDVLPWITSWMLILNDAE